MIKLKNILAENMFRFGTKNLSESDKRRLREMHYKALNLMEQEVEKYPEDPSQQSIAITTEFTAVQAAAESFAAEYNKKYLAGMIDPRDRNKKFNEWKYTTKPKKDKSGNWINPKPLGMWFSISYGGYKGAERVFGLYTNCKTDFADKGKFLFNDDNGYEPFIKYNLIGKDHVINKAYTATYADNTESAKMSKEILEYTEGYGNDGKNGECVDSSINLTSAANTLATAVLAMFTAVYTAYYNKIKEIGAKRNLKPEDIMYNFGAFFSGHEVDSGTFKINLKPDSDLAKIKPKP
jgi:hypothetical protein